MSDVWFPMSGQSVKMKKNFEWPYYSATRHPIDFVYGFRLGFFSKDGLALLNLTAHELHELYHDRPTS